MIAYARETSVGYQNISYLLIDVFDDQLLQVKPDIVICSLFCHHFEDEALIRLLERMTVLAADAVIINDLHGFSD